MIHFTTANLQEWIHQFLWPLFRIGGFFMIVPIIGTQLVPIRIRMVLALAVTFLVHRLIGPVPSIDSLSLEALLVIIQQVTIGMAMAFAVQVLFQIFVVGGQIIAMQNGLGFAQMMDPVNGVSVATVGQFLIVTSNLLFLALNGHLVLISVIVDSFEALPISIQGLPADSFYEIAGLGTWLFKGAVLMALPAVISLLIVNITFGTMARVAPQMNIFAIGFPFTLMLGLVIIWMVMSGLRMQFEKFSLQMFDFLRILVS